MVRFQVGVSCCRFGNISTDMDTVRLQDLDKLLDWADKWQMMFNASKCKVMHFGKKNHNTDYYMNGQRLLTITEEKDLGVVNSSKMK